MASLVSLFIGWPGIARRARYPDVREILTRAPSEAVTAAQMASAPTSTPTISWFQNAEATPLKPRA
jgi:hypothetical protein